ncbi:methylmalonyl-CoA mutase [Robertmurraya kyonggiensis]|uniref:methylmalonyl-CoA mutase n=2 Tax=Robertmurraya kyonggiensis TaxID=1037680 RepID=A0A4U1DE16_9BACI|nr:methylmalonyl-CoA mutase [Robertmurraya kyonggiensis]
MREQSFPSASLEDWKAKSEESLKGRKIETLAKDTYEGIKLKPLYTRQNQTVASPFPAQGDFRRGVNALGYVSQEWKVAQKIHVDELKVSLQKAMEKGQTAISFEVNDAILTQLEDLEEFHGQYPYSLNGKGYHGQLLDAVSRFASAVEGTGFIAQDPIAILAENGAAEGNVIESYKELYESISSAAQTLPNVRTILVDTTPYHNGGANAVQELAIAISTGVMHIEELSSCGLGLDKTLSKLVFQFSIGANFFMEVAKLRAARVLWSKVAETYGSVNQGMVISATTSSYTKTIFDPYVNMLRAGNEAFAAVLGGVQYLHVSPFNEPEGVVTEFSGRIARNTQLILREEAHLTKTIDPAGGSWYIEHLTNELTDKAWQLFIEIDEKGGILEGLKQGWIQSEIASVREKRINAVATRKQTIVGTNKYVDLNGDSLNIQEEKSEKTTGFIKPIPHGRLAQNFECLRQKASLLKKKGNSPVLGLITLGDLKSHKMRMDFVQGFLSPGGIESKVSGDIIRAEDAFEFIKETSLRHYVICGTNEQYEEFALAVVEQLKETYPNVQLYLAGIPEEKSRWEQAGIKDFIHAKSNCYETLSSLLDDMEVGANE